MILVAWLNMMIENPFKNAGVVRDRTKKMLDKSFRRGYHGLVLSGGRVPAAMFGSGARLLCSELSASFHCSTFCRIAKTSSF